MVDAHVGGGPLSAAAAMDPRGAVFYRRHAAKFQSDARLSFSAWVAEPALAEPGSTSLMLREFEKARCVFQRKAATDSN